MRIADDAMNNDDRTHGYPKLLLRVNSRDNVLAVLILHVLPRTGNKLYRYRVS
jgi:hypothetical protein